MLEEDLYSAIQLSALTCSQSCLISFLTISRSAHLGQALDTANSVHSAPCRDCAIDWRSLANLERPACASCSSHFAAADCARVCVHMRVCARAHACICAGAGAVRACMQAHTCVTASRASDTRCNAALTAASSTRAASSASADGGGHSMSANALSSGSRLPC